MRERLLVWYRMDGAEISLTRGMHRLVIDQSEYEGLERVVAQAKRLRDATSAPASAPTPVPTPAPSRAVSIPERQLRELIDVAEGSGVYTSAYVDEVVKNARLLLVLGEKR